MTWRGVASSRTGCPRGLAKKNVRLVGHGRCRGVFGPELAALVVVVVVDADEAVGAPLEVNAAGPPFRVDGMHEAQTETRKTIDLTNAVNTVTITTAQSAHPDPSSSYANMIVPTSTTSSLQNENGNQKVGTHRHAV